MSSGSSVEVLVRRDRVVASGGAALLVALSWLTLARGPWAAHVSQGILTANHIPFGPSTLALAALMWLLMMVAMMVPAVMPWILLFASVSRGRSTASSQVPTATALFVMGYLTVWGGFAAAAAPAQLLLQRAGMLGTRLDAQPFLAALMLIGAGVYQLAPIKAACLRHCRSPLSFLLTRWRDGPMAAFELGYRHGIYCLGCCWALMMLAFALGVMNLFWMAVLTLVVCLEKLAPGGRFLSWMFGIAFVTWGAWLAAGGSV